MQDQRRDGAHPDSGPVPGRYATRSWARASQALRCLPFRRGFYDRVSERAIASREFCQLPQASHFCWGRMGPERVEAHFAWLIRLGVLRREVDGQGLTERVRLTPMGRELVQQWSGEIPRAALADRIAL